MNEHHPDIRIAVIVDPSLGLGFLANTVGVIAVGLGAVMPALGNTTLIDARRRVVKNSADRPLPVLQASAERIGEVLLKALPAPDGAAIVPFPAFARALHSFEEYRARFPQCDLAAERIDGLGLAGPAKWIRSLTGSLKLLR
ncbi:MAG TPA: DUF2000 domain-containing protein [Ferrovibrio sp.]|jgi:hypothetical protein|uniref:DUF2000 domain-containing protein n=1 Tax=Ferrovibrio sp. TaxID=1917215 RepID=UPI002ED50F19